MNTEALARQYGKPVQEQNAEAEYLFTLEGVEALLAAEREACAKDAEWCIQNHLEHLMPERIRARSNS